MPTPPPPMRSCECGHGKDQHYTFADGAVLACSLSDCVCREFRPIPPSGHVARATTVAGSGGEGNVKKIHNGSTKPPASGAEDENWVSDCCGVEYKYDYALEHATCLGCGAICSRKLPAPSQGAEGCEHDFVTFRDDPHRTCRKCFQAEGVGEWEKDLRKAIIKKSFFNPLTGELAYHRLETFIRSTLATATRAAEERERSRVEGEWRRHIRNVIGVKSDEIEDWDAGEGEKKDAHNFLASIESNLLPTPSSQGGNNE